MLYPQLYVRQDSGSALHDITPSSIPDLDLSIDLDKDKMSFSAVHASIDVKSACESDREPLLTGWNQFVLFIGVFGAQDAVLGNNEWQSDIMVTCQNGKC